MKLVRLKTACATAAALALSACVSVPAGPSLQALPGSRMSFDQFATDDGQCRGVATAQIGGRSPSDAGNQSAVASAAAGTVVGAAAGGLIDGSAGAAAGAGVGLLFGAAAGSATYQEAYGITQQRFDSAYYSCMYARGHKVPVPAYDAARYRAGYESAAPRGTGSVPPPPADLPPPDYRAPTAPR